VSDIHLTDEMAARSDGFIHHPRGEFFGLPNNRLGRVDILGQQEEP
jgi:hypothetical protein